MNSKTAKPERRVKIIVLLVVLGGEAMFFFQNKVFFHFFGGLSGIKDFSSFAELGLYGLKPEDFLHLEEAPLLVAIMAVFITLDVYLLSQIFK